VYCLAARNRAASDAENNNMLQGMTDYLHMLVQLEDVFDIEYDAKTCRKWQAKCQSWPIISAILLRF
jgi:hypothetical protein